MISSSSRKRRNTASALIRLQPNSERMPRSRRRATTPVRLRTVGGSTAAARIISTTGRAASAYARYPFTWLGQTAAIDSMVASREWLCDHLRSLAPHRGVHARLDVDVLEPV